MKFVQYEFQVFKEIKVIAEKLQYFGRPEKVYQCTKQWASDWCNNLININSDKMISSTPTLESSILYMRLKKNE